MRSRIPIVRVTPTVLSLGVAIWMSVVLNIPFWRAAWAATKALSSTAFLLTLPAAVTLWIALVLELLAWGRARKAVFAALLLLAATASYFMLTYGVLLDRSMMANVFQTHAAEALELITWRFVLWTLSLGLLPAAIVFLVPVARSSCARELWRKTRIVATLSAALVSIVFAFFPSYASLARNHRDLRLQLVPTNFLAAAYSYGNRRLATPAVVQPVGLDATARTRPAGGRPRVMLLVVGETARAANFSLLGYGRRTNPRLAAENDLVPFSSATSCGTATAVSLPCMFLDAGRERFDLEMASTRESLLDVLQRAGVKVLWRDNNSGCKGICDRVPNEVFARDPFSNLCSVQECWDEVLLSGLDQHLERVTSDTVIVLHMKGSHGPAYYRRYPPAFEQFKPVCRDAQLDRCSRESIVNAYDNSVLYTDHVVGQAIEILRSRAKTIDAGMLFVSDHGESLGEKGIYLHGLPYALAPDEQKRIPFLLWLPAERMRDWRLDATCTRRRASEPVSHDDLYPMVLGLMGVSTSLYDRSRDVFSPCRDRSPG